VERGKKVTLVVADASVIVKWFVDEEHTKNALALRQSYIDGKVDIACPQFLPYEVLNALRYNPELGEEQVRTASLALEKYQFWLHPLTEELAGLCIKNAFALGISLYDSSYLSLAQHIDAAFYTADQRMLDKLKDNSGRNTENFRHISEFKVRETGRRKDGRL
jgi:predicted nucleic acid-binding protein